MFSEEYTAAKAAGLHVALIDFEALIQGAPDRAVRRLEHAEHEISATYRGWMMRPDIYSAFHKAAAVRGYQLVNSPRAYEACHLFPGSYELIRQRTPASTWVPAGEIGNLDTVVRAAASLGSGPAIVKDYVKSRKHEWLEACFIPSATDEDAVRQVVGRFVELQGDDLVGGIVLRKFVEFQSIGAHSQSGMPLSLEYRIFWLDGRPLFTSEYWVDQGYYKDSEVPVTEFAPIAKSVPSRFFSMDIAKGADGQWLIMELGDGQVAGLPSDSMAPDFYRALGQYDNR